jgi:7-cyano-7-deazaguanine synthase
MTNLVLLSGGMDSTLALYSAIASGQYTTALSIDYGQPHCVQEMSAAASIAHHAEVPLVRARVQLVGVHTPGAVVPARNMVLLSLAANWLDEQGGGTVFFGACADDDEGFPDCRQEFVAEFNQLMHRCELHVQVRAPWINMTKTQMLLKMIDVPGVEEAVGMSYSCYAGTEEPCGVCEACRKRQRAFDQLSEARPR